MGIHAHSLGLWAPFHPTIKEPEELVFLGHSRQSKTDSQARLSLSHEESEDDHAFSLLSHLVHPDEPTLDLASLFDPLMDFTHPNFSKAKILKLSYDLSRTWIHSDREGHPADRTVRPACVFLLTTVHVLGSDESGQ